MTVASLTRRVAIAGNPNTGKTTLFNQLTGSRGKVGNYPGVTVERQFGPLELPDGRAVELVDVPGTYSLSARSQEEQLAVQAVAGLHPLEAPDLVVCVVDATQLERNLYLVLQVVELDLPVVVALNMTDRLEATGQRIDVRAMERELDVPVVPVVANKARGLDELRRAIGEALDDPARARPGCRWQPEDPLLESDIRSTAELVPAEWSRGSEARARAFGVWALLSLDEHDELVGVPAALRDAVVRRRRLAEVSGRQLEEQLVRLRYDWIDDRARHFLRATGAAQSATDRIDRILLHPALGFAIFVVGMTVVFQSLFSWADPMIGVIETVVARVGGAVARVLPEGVFADFVIDGVITGVGSVIVFLPQILLLFFFVGLMEDTGYMARVAYLMDRIMKALGLHGRAFVPMLSGYACAVPAILATRTMERQRDRLLTMMVVPLMTCSARLPVYGLLIAALAPAGDERPWMQGLLLTAMYLFSTVVALLAAAVLGRTVLRGPRTPLLLEMPPYRVPHWPSVLTMMWRQSRVFLKEAGSVILVCTIVVWVLLSFPRAGASEDDAALREAPIATEAVDPPAGPDRVAAREAEERGERLRQSWGGRLGRALEPALEPLGFDWKIGIGLVGAFAAREVFVSTMAVVYGLDEGEDETSMALRERVRQQRRPDGSKVYTPLVCLSLMVFFALACQCMSTLAVVRRETRGWRWPTFLFVYTGLLAWVASLIVYQGGRLCGWS